MARGVVLRGGDLDDRDLVTTLAAEVSSRMRDRPGFVSLLIFHDRDSSTLRSVTMWDGDTAAASLDADTATVISAIAARTSAHVDGPRTYDVLRTYTRRPATPADRSPLTWARVDQIDAYGPGARKPAVIGAVTTWLATSRGCTASLLLQDRRAHSLLAVSTFVPPRPRPGALDAPPVGTTGTAVWAGPEGPYDVVVAIRGPAAAAFAPN